MQETSVKPLGWEDPLEEGMATCSSILAWRIPWAGEPQGCQESDTIEVTEYAHTCYAVGCQAGPRLANKMIILSSDAPEQESRGPDSS